MRANKAIGLAIVRQLAKEGITVVFRTRDVTHGIEAIESLKKQRFHNMHFHNLDLGRQESINALVEWLHTTYGSIDILVSTF
jgi:NAD(P)-dependent dehydrogenase (short-subunit alcohol dehydrogenase family)